MKKQLGLGMATLATLLLLGACGSDNSTASSSSSSTESSSMAASTTESSTNATTEAWQDGEYTAEASEYSNGYKEYVTVTIADGKITMVDFDAKDESGNLKTADESYKEKMEASNGTYPEEYMKTLEDELVKTQSTASVDAVTGATHSSGDFKVLADAALANAAKGDTETAVVTLAAE
ncbi:FMN-binding protein [Enterococcus sp. LJL90]